MGSVRNITGPWLVVGGPLASHWPDTGHQASRSVKLTLDLMSLDTMLTRDIFLLQGHILYNHEGRSVLDGLTISKYLN